MTDLRATSAPLWWGDKKLVNGVFKGGGAKGVAYAGALRAFREAGYWYGSVAGASAGAITAALIAAGLTPEEIELQVPVALSQLAGSVPARLVSLVRGSTSSLFDSENLRHWLEQVLTEECRKRGHDTGEYVTFTELFDTTGIELYVVAMDLASGTPLVFSRRTTPQVEVSAAVTASCAIPGAFPAGRAVFRHPTHGAGVHQLVDGGTFANYPTFVFRDQSFRSWIGDTDGVERERPTVGFVLGERSPIDRTLEAVGFVTDVKPIISRRFDLGPTYTAQKTGSYIFGAILSNDFARLALGIAITVWAGLSIGFFPQGVRLVSTWLRFVPGPLFALAIVGLFVSLILTAGISFLAIVALIGISRMVADTLLPAAKSAIGVATEVVPWAGFGDDDVMLVVPHPGLHTTQFNVSADLRAHAVQTAYVEVCRQLADPTIRTKLGVATPELLVPPVVVSLADLPETSAWHALWRGFVLAAVLAFFVALLGWYAVNAQANAHWFWQSLLIGTCSLAAAIVGVLWFAKSAGGRAAANARIGVGVRLHATRPAAAVLALALVVFVGGALLSGHAAKVRAEDTHRVSIRAAQLIDGRKQYLIRYNEVEYPFWSSADLGLGEFVYVKIVNGVAQLEQPLASPTFPIAIGLEVLGLGLFLSAYRASSWARRSNRLTSWLALRREPTLAST